MAGAVAAIELLLLLLIGGGKLVALASDRLQLAAKERAVPTQAKVAPSRRNIRRTPAPVPRRPRSKTSVIVLNGNGRTGAGASAASSPTATASRRSRMSQTSSSGRPIASLRAPRASAT